MTGYDIIYIDMTLSHALTFFMVTVSCIIIASIVFNRTTFEMGTELQIFSFRRLLGCYILFVVSNGICLWADYSSDYDIGNIFALVNLLALAACSFFWFRYIEATLDIADHSKLGNFSFFLPLLIIIILISTSIFTKLIYFYYPDTGFTRGPLYPIMFIVPVFYLVYASFFVVKRYLKTTSPTEKKDLLYLLSFAILPVIARLIDLVAPNLPVMELSMLISLVLIYISLQDRLIYVDSLTGMSNRRVADKYLTSQLELASVDNPLLFFLADCDDFKLINDNYGHLEGDTALRIIASELEKLSLKYTCHVSRWGGDEFVLIARSNGIPKPEELIDQFLNNLRNRIKEENLPYDIPISVGYIPCYDPNINIIDLFGEAEDLMYKTKQINKKARAHQ